MKSALIVNNSDAEKYKVWISSAAMDAIITEANKWPEYETGGVLIGYRSSEYEYVVTYVIGPGPKAKRTTSSFVPDYAFQKKRIAAIYKNSGHIKTYLGDWHTHPNSSPYLSEQDKKTFKTIALHKPARLPVPLMLIIAPPENRLKIWFLINDKTIEAKIILYNES